MIDKIGTCPYLKQNPAYDLPFFIIALVEDLRLRFQVTGNTQ